MLSGCRGAVLGAEGWARRITHQITGPSKFVLEAARYHSGRVLGTRTTSETGEQIGLRSSLDEHSELWRRLYEQEYQSKARLAKFLAAATDLVEQRKAARQSGSRGTPEVQDLEEAFMISGKEHGGYEVPNGIIARDVVVDMARHLSGGQRLRSASFVRLLDEAQAILVTCPNITLIPAFTKVTVVGDLHGSLEDLLKVVRVPKKIPSWFLERPPMTTPLNHNHSKTTAHSAARQR